MRYEELLEDLTRLTAVRTDFDSGLVSGYLSTVKNWGPGGLPVRFSPKRISNDLNRLYRMQLLKRKRIKRTVTTRTGKSCKRGFRYVYSMTKQGISYSHYLETPRPFRLFQQGLERKINFFRDIDNLPAIALIKRSSPAMQVYDYKKIEGLIYPMMNKEYKGGYNRFPPKVDLALLFHAIEREEEFQGSIELISEKVDMIAANKEKADQLIAELLEMDALAFLKVAYRLFFKYDTNPAIWADKIVVQGSKGITADSGVSLLQALSWIIRELERRGIRGKRLVR